MRTATLHSLVYRCITQMPILPCVQCTTLRSFHPRPQNTSESPSLFNTSPKINLGCKRRTRNDIRTFSRRRNIFLDPAEKDDALASLYDSSRFNDDDDDIITTSDNDLQHSHNFKGVDDSIDEVVDDEATSDTEHMSSTQHMQKLPQAKNIKVRIAEFIKSSVNEKDCPPPVYPEFAVIGRSNVGKSSIINLLTGRNSLAMVSKTPGKTRCINHFFINKAWYLVDLPGYGYAKTSKTNVLQWNKFTREYFLERETLVSVLLLIDASIPPMELDVSCAQWLVDAEIPFTLVYTKIDKKKKGVPSAAENIAAFEERLKQDYDELPPAIATSSKTGAGKMELLNHIAQLRALYNANIS